jgi:hypothetical protein
MFLGGFFRTTTSLGEIAMSAAFKKMTQVGFFKVCDAMRTHREAIDKLRTVPEVIDFLSKTTGELVTKSSYQNICEAAGFKPAGISRSQHHDTNNSRRILTNAMVSLYEKFGEPVPEMLASLWSVCNEKPYQPPKPSIPVASIPKPTTLSIAK